MSEQTKERLLWLSVIVISVNLSWQAFKSTPDDMRPMIGGALNLIDIPAVIYLWLNIAWPWLGARRNK